MCDRRSNQKDSVDQELIEWARNNLEGIIDDENYAKMISGVGYEPFLEHYELARLESNEATYEYQNIRLKDFSNQKEFLEYRRQCIGKLFGKCGKNTYVEPPIYVDFGFNVCVGDNFYCNFNTTFLDSSLIIIGDNVWLGPNVTISSVSHPLEAKARLTAIEHALPVRIGNNVWIGANVVILGGVTVGDNAVLAAGAVISKDVPANVVAGGVPAKVIREIDNSE